MKEKPSNPLDADPEIEIVFPDVEEGDVITSDSLTVSLGGNSDYSMFRFRLDSTGWSDFSYESEITFTMLDDGEHLLEIESMYEGHSDVSYATHSFIVKALDSTAAYIVPQRVVLDSSDTVVVGVGIRSVTACDRMHFSFIGSAAIDSIYLPETDRSDSLVLLANDTIADILVIPGAAPFLEAETVFMMRIIAGPEKNSTDLSFECVARDTNNTAIALDQVRGCILVRE